MLLLQDMGVALGKNLKMLRKVTTALMYNPAIKERNNKILLRNRTAYEGIYLKVIAIKSSFSE